MMFKLFGGPSLKGHKSRLNTIKLDESVNAVHWALMMIDHIWMPEAVQADSQCWDPEVVFIYRIRGAWLEFEPI